MMCTWLTAVVLASSVTFVVSANNKQNSPTYVPNRCFLDKAQGSCRDLTRSYFFNVTAGYCQTFVYGGCGGNWNRFNTLSACHKTCTCATPPETGPCRGHIRRWFYSPADGCCRPFIYGGCGGNSNNYATWTECSDKCGYPTADSSWWKWGAQWGNWSGGRPSGSKPENTSYSRNDFMRDWMLWAMLAGGEFEMEDLARLIGQAHIFGLGKSRAGKGASSAGGFGGFGSQMFGQESANGFNGAGLAGNMQSSGMANWGPTYKTARPGSFTPLGHIGSIANMLNGEASEWIGGAHAMGQLAAALGGFQGGAQHWDGSSQGSFGQSASGQGNSWAGAMGTGMSGQGMWGSQGQGLVNQGSAGSAGFAHGQGQGLAGAMGTGMSGQGMWGSQGQGLMNQDSVGSAGLAQGSRTHGEGMWNTRGVQSSDFIDMGSGALGYMGSGQGRRWNRGQMGTGSSGQGVGSTAIEILHLISQIGRGALGPSDLINLGQRYGAVSPSGNVDVNLLATRMVATLQGPRGNMNMARLKGVANRLGALDNNGNINIPLMIKGVTETLSGGGFGNGLGVGGIPTLDEFNWLGSGKGSVGSRIQGGGTGGGGGATAATGVVGGSEIRGTGVGSGPLVGGGGAGGFGVGAAGTGGGRGATGTGGGFGAAGIGGGFGAAGTGSGRGAAGTGDGRGAAGTGGGFGATGTGGGRGAAGTGGGFGAAGTGGGFGAAGTGGGFGAAGAGGAGSQGVGGSGWGASGTAVITAGGGGARMGSYGKK